MKVGAGNRRRSMPYSAIRLVVSAGTTSPAAMAWTISAADWFAVIEVEVLPPGGTDSGPNPGSSASDLADGTGSWTGTGNVFADDASYAVWTVV